MLLFVVASMFAFALQAVPAFAAGSPGVTAAFAVPADLGMPQIASASPTAATTATKPSEATMTTTVTIAAHLSADKEVQVAVTENTTGATLETFALQDGEKAERYVYDGREISVKEVLKV